MEVRTLGQTGLRIGVIGLGAMPFGSAETPEAERAAIEIVHAVAERQPAGGRLLIDTAALYGQGRSEALIGKALRERPDLRDRVLVVTKVGRCPREFDYTYDETMPRIEASLERLGMERLPLVYIHDAFPDQLATAMGPGGCLEALRKLRDEGVIEHIGVAINFPENLAPYIETGEFEAAVVPEAFSLLNQDAEARIFPAASRFQMGVTVATPLEKGLLAAGTAPLRSGALTYRVRSFSEECLTHVERIETLCAAHDVSLLAAGLQYIVRHPQVTAAIPGADTLEQAMALLDAADEPIPSAFWGELQPLVRHWDRYEHRRPPRIDEALRAARAG